MERTTVATLNSAKRYVGPISLPSAGYRVRTVPLALWLALIVLLGTALRAFRLGYQSLWFDEVLTVLSSTGSMFRVLTQTEINTLIPPLYYLLVNRAMALGEVEAILRLPSLIVSSLSILLFFMVIRHWLGRRIAVASTLLMAISPFHIWYSQDARPYSFLLFLALLSLWCFQQIRQHPQSLGWKIGFGISTAATAMTHTVALGFFSFLCALVLIHADRRELRRWMPVALGVLVLILPAIPRLAAVVLEDLPRTAYVFEPLHLGYIGWVFATGFSLGPSVADLHAPHPAAIALQYASVVAPLLMFFGILLLLGTRRLWKDNRFGLLVLLLWLLIPVAVALLGASLTGHPFNVRYTIISFPPFLGFVAVGVEDLRVRPLRVGAWCLLVLTMGFSLGNYYFNPKYQKEDTRAAAAILRDQAQPWDVVIVSAGYSATTLMYYLDREDIVVLRYPGSNALALSTMYGTPEDADLGSRREQVSAQLERVGREKGGFWVFLSRSFHGDREGHLLAASNAAFQQDLEFRGAGVHLTRFIVPR